MTVFVAVHKVLSLCRLISSYCQWLRKSYIVKNICSLVVKPSTQRLHKMAQIPPMTFWSKISVFYVHVPRDLAIHPWPGVFAGRSTRKTVLPWNRPCDLFYKVISSAYQLGISSETMIATRNFHLWMLKPTPTNSVPKQIWHVRKSLSLVNSSLGALPMHLWLLSLSEYIHTIQ